MTYKGIEIGEKPTLEMVSLNIDYQLFITILKDIFHFL